MGLRPSALSTLKKGESSRRHTRYQSRAGAAALSAKRKTLISHEAGAGFELAAPSSPPATRTCTRTDELQALLFAPRSYY